MVPLLCLLLLSIILNALLFNDYLQARRDRARQRKQEELSRCTLVELEQQEAEERYELEAALDRLLQKIVIFEHDLLDTSPEIEAEIERYCLIHDEPYIAPQLPEAHRSFYEQFQIIEKSITFLNRRCASTHIDREEIDFYDSLLADLWNTYRKACGRNHLPEFFAQQDATSA